VIFEVHSAETGKITVLSYFYYEDGGKRFSETLAMAYQNIRSHRRRN
jgi:hypothetical protein